MSLTINDLDAHGIHFIFGEYRNKFTKFLWTFIIVLSLCGFSFYVYEIRQKWELSPDIVTIIKGGQINEFPSPAVSICPNIFARDNLASYANAYEITFNFTAYSNYTCDLDKEEFENLVANLHWCNLYGNEILKKINCTLKENFNIVQTIKNTSLKINEFFYSCSVTLYSKIYLDDCNKIFSSLVTDFGVCFTFNMQNFETIFNDENIHEDLKFDHKIQDQVQWSLEKGYFNRNASYPYRNGRPFDAQFKFHVSDLDAQNFCDYNSEFLVVIHRPNEIPTTFHESYKIEFKKHLYYFTNIESRRTSEELRRYAPSLRKCYFEDERKLYYFKSYTKALCELECQSNWTLEHCGCVKFSMPRNKSIPVCDKDNFECFRIYNPKSPRDSMIPCDCFPPCNDIIFSTGEKALFFWDRFDKSNEEYFATFRFYCKEGLLAKVVEDFASYKLQNLVADIGGLFGLFLGGSILTIIEIFCIILSKLTCNSQKSKESSNKYKKLDKEISKTRLKIEKITISLKNYEKSEMTPKIKIFNIDL